MKKGLSRKSRPSVPGVPTPPGRGLAKNRGDSSVDHVPGTPGAAAVVPSSSIHRGLANNRPPPSKSVPGATTVAVVQESSRGAMKLAKLANITGRPSVAGRQRNPTTSNQEATRAPEYVQESSRGATKLAKLATLTGRQQRSNNTSSSVLMDAPGHREDTTSIARTCDERIVRNGDLRPASQELEDSASSIFAESENERTVDNLHGRAENLQDRADAQHPTTAYLTNIESRLDDSEVVSTTEELPRAQPVIGDDNPMVVETNVEEVDVLEEEQRHKKQRRRTFCFVGSGMIIITGIILVILFTLVIDFNSFEDQVVVVGATSPTTLSPTGSPSMVPSLSRGEYFKTLLPSFTVDAIENIPASAQYMAFQWIENDIILGNNYSDERLLERFALMSVYYATNGEAWYDRTSWGSHNTSECQWFSNYDFEPDAVSQQNFAASAIGDMLQDGNPCNAATHEIAALYLNSNGLAGTIPPEIELLTSLNALRLGYNKLHSTIPSELGMLTQLMDVNLAGNELTGRLPTELGLLTYAIMLSLEVNQLSGTLPSELGQLSRLVLFNVDDEGQNAGNSLNGLFHCFFIVLLCSR